jgi:hypothetical protein
VQQLKLSQTLVEIKLPTPCPQDNLLGERLPALLTRFFAAKISSTQLNPSSEPGAQATRGGEPGAQAAHGGDPCGRRGCRWEVGN